MAKKTGRYVIWISTRPYIEKYLLHNFRVVDSNWTNLVNLSEDRELSAFISTRLSKPEHRYDKKEKMKRDHNSRVAIEISKDSFYRYGWALSPSDEIDLNRALDIRCKTICMTFLAATYQYIGNLNECIRRFYQTFSITEDDWSSETIRKMWQREKRIGKICVNDLNFVKNTQFILENLSLNGTISENGKKAYENNLI